MELFTHFPEMITCLAEDPHVWSHSCSEVWLASFVHLNQESEVKRKTHLSAGLNLTREVLVYSAESQDFLFKHTYFSGKKASLRKSVI